MEQLLNNYIWAPVLAMIGIIIVGAIIEDTLGIQNATFALFIAVGGIWLFATFFGSR